MRKQELCKKIKAIHEESHEIYGAPKITVKLNQSGIKVSEKYIGNIMREMA
ncbi:MAG: IS3 family transposase [Beduini sp.]